MFESILRHKQVVIAAIAITALAGYVVPLNQFAIAQDDSTITVDDVINQEGTATASGQQNPTITAPNTQTNAIVTGDATAAQSNTATSTANAAAVAFGGDAIGGDGGEDGCDDCKDGKKKWDWKKHDDKCDKCSGGSGDGGFAVGGDADADADATSSATVSGNTNVADTSADDNTQSNTNTQTFDLDLDQDVDADVDQDAFQFNDNYLNLDVEFDD